MNISDIKHCCKCKCHKPRTDFSESTCTRDRAASSWGASPSGRLVQSLAGAFIIAYLTKASMAEMMLMFMVLRLQVDAYYD